MTDRLTQLQDCLDELLNQMFYAVKYIQDRAPYANISGQPDQTPAADLATAAATGNGEVAQQQQSTQQAPSSPIPHERGTFNANLREMAQDLVLREQQIEYLINSLPGMGNSQSDQEQRMRTLESELREAQAERLQAETVRQDLVNGLGDIILGARRVG